MNKKILTTTGIIIVLIIGLVTAYSIDKYRMKHNLPVIFSTWGHSYAPPELLPFQVNTNNELGCVELKNDGIVYRPFGIIGGKSSLRLSQIGFRDDDSSATIYSLKGFDSSEWIIETDEGFMTVGDMLYKSIDVQEIPKELEKYKGYDFDEDNNEGNMTNQNESFRIDIEIGSQTFKATLENNETTREFMRLMPMTINMIDHLSNEKYYDLSDALPTNSYNPSHINSGDIMLFGSNTLVLFYENFNTSYNYTRLGKIDDITNLKSSLGKGNIDVNFRLSD